MTETIHCCAFIDTVRPGLRAWITGRRVMPTRVVNPGDAEVGDPIVMIR